MRKYLTEWVSADTVKPGDRLAVCFGVMTVRAVARDGERITWHWVEDQPAVTQHRSNGVERITGLRCEVTPKGEQCCLPMGHSGGHRWARGD